MKLSVISIAALALVPLGASIAPGSAAFKCGRRAVSPLPVYVLNGKIVDSTAIQAIKAESIEDLYVACSDERYSVFGVEPLRDAVVIFTAPGPSTALKRGLDSIKVLQGA